MGNIGELFQIFRLVTSWLIWLDTDPGPHPQVKYLDALNQPRLELMTQLKYIYKSAKFSF